MIVANKLVLIDGNSILFRAFFALPLLHNDKGVYTNALYGFTNILLKILEEEKPTHMLVAFDAGKTTFRHEKFSEYKGGRQQTPPELSEQFPLSRKLLDAFQIPHYELELYEADDIIGTLSKQAEEKGWEVKVITGDQDLIQLVSERVTVDVTRKGITEVVSYTPESMLEKMELKPEQIVDLLALMGDKSDNIPGVPGVGIKTATKLLKQYGTIENIYEHIDEISGKKLKENLLNHKDDAFLSKELATIHRASPLTISTDDLSYGGFTYDDVYELFQELGFRSLLDRLHSEVEHKDQEDLADIEFSIVEAITEEMLVD